MHGRHQGRQARQDRDDQPGRQHQVQGQGHPRHLRAEDAELAVLVQAGRPLLARIAARAIWRSSAPTTWTAATPISRSSRRRSRSRPKKTTCTSPSTSTEGDVFKVSEIKLAGTMVVPEAQLRKLLLIQPGDIFSRKLVTSSQELMSYRLGADGYAFSKIDPVPTPDNDKKTVSLTFFIEPGNRVYVRHINFNNTTAINDETLRREMRQLEGGWLSNSAIERSKERLQRLPYVEKVEFETKPVAGSADLVDVDYNIKEGLPRAVRRRHRLLRSAEIQPQRQFRAQQLHGHRRSHRARRSTPASTARPTRFRSTDPYTTIDGMARTDLADLPRHHAVRRGRLEVLDQAVDPGRDLVLPDHRIPVPAASARPPTRTSWWSRRATARSRPSIGCSTTATPSRAIWTTPTATASINSLDNPYTVYGTDFYTYELQRRLELRHAQPRAVRRPRHAPGGIGPLRPAVQRGAVLRANYAVPPVHPGLAQMAAVVQRERRLRPTRSARPPSCRPT